MRSWACATSAARAGRCTSRTGWTWVSSCAACETRNSRIALTRRASATRGLTRVIDRHTKDLLEAGNALIVGTVDPAGQPHATRAWGLEVVDADGGRVRIVLPGDDPVTVENLRTTGRLALTATSVPTL